METHHYICEYCKKEYVPRRRGVQKYCSSSCRSRDCQLRNKKIASAAVQSNPTTLSHPAANLQHNQIKVEEMTASGVKDSTLGTVFGNTITDFGKYVFTPELQKPATKGDILRIEQYFNQRYHEIINMQPNFEGKTPFYDMHTMSLVYLDK